MFEIADNPSGITIRPKSDMIAEASEKLYLLLTELLNKGGRKLRFDLSAVTDMDAAAFHIFFLLSKTMSEKYPDAESEIVNACPDVVNLFEMTGLSKYHRISESPGKD